MMSKLQQEIIVSGGLVVDLDDDDILDSGDDDDIDDQPRDRQLPQKETLISLDSTITTTTTTTRSSSSSSSSLASSSSFTTSSSVAAAAAGGCPEHVLEKYADRRSMTPLQEKINAITMLPTAFFCLHYIITGQYWIRQRQKGGGGDDEMDDTTATTVPPLPPTAVLAICLGVLLHCPCSFLYHWKYASNYPNNPTERLQHWSRRLDHSAIHACSIFWSYGLSLGRAPWFVAINAIYNVDCIRCHWEHDIQPRRNQLRILISILLYTSPILLFPMNDNNDDAGSFARRIQLFGKVWAVFIVALWFFAAYPIGGWSHAAFHILLVAVPPLLLEIVAEMTEESSST